MAILSRNIASRINQFRSQEVDQALERQTTRVPSLIFLGLAATGVIISSVIELSGRTTTARRYADWVGSFVPSFLLLAVYDKLVQLSGVEETS